MINGLVSVIIPVYNRPELLIDSVQSALDQTYRPIEIIIVDDGSTDRTQKVAEKLSKTHSEVQIIRIDNSGPGPAREAGTNIAQGEFVQFLDSDDLLHPDKLHRQVNALMSQPKYGVSYCRQDLVDMDGNVIEKNWMRTGEHHRTLFPAMLAGRIWGTPVPLYRRSVLDQAGPWTDLKNLEDWEYDCRIASLGPKLHYENATLVIIRRHQLDHFGQLNRGKNQIRDRVKAHLLILKHAYQAKVAPESVEFRHFIRALFLLCRQCSALDMRAEAKQLMDTIHAFTGSSISQRIEYRLFSFGALLLGWKTIGQWSERLDKARS